MKCLLRVSVAVACLFLAPSLITAQEKQSYVKGQEHHHALAAYLRSAMIHAKALHHLSLTMRSMDKEVVQEHVDEKGDGK